MAALASMIELVAIASPTTAPPFKIDRTPCPNPVCFICSLFFKLRQLTAMKIVNRYAPNSTNTRLQREEIGKMWPQYGVSSPHGLSGAGNHFRTRLPGEGSSDYDRSNRLPGEARVAKKRRLLACRHDRQPLLPPAVSALGNHPLQELRITWKQSSLPWRRLAGAL